MRGAALAGSRSPPDLPDSNYRVYTVAAAWFFLCFRFKVTLLFRIMH